MLAELLFSLPLFSHYFCCEPGKAVTGFNEHFIILSFHHSVFFTAFKIFRQNNWRTK